MQNKPKVEAVIDIKKYIYEFDIGPLLTPNTVLCTFIIWPNGNSEKKLLNA
jgi:hypothetical protein